MQVGKSLQSFQVPSLSSVKLNADRPDFAMQPHLILAVHEESDFLEQAIF
jgi:hypothetical protein